MKGQCTEKVKRQLRGEHDAAMQTEREREPESEQDRERERDRDRDSYPLLSIRHASAMSADLASGCTSDVCENQKLFFRISTQRSRNPVTRVSFLTSCQLALFSLSASSQLISFSPHPTPPHPPRSTPPHHPTHPPPPHGHTNCVALAPLFNSEYRIPGVRHQLSSGRRLQGPGLCLPLAFCFPMLVFRESASSGIVCFVGGLEQMEGVLFRWPSPLFEQGVRGPFFLSSPGRIRYQHNEYGSRQTKKEEEQQDKKKKPTKVGIISANRQFQGAEPVNSRLRGAGLRC